MRRWDARKWLCVVSFVCFGKTNKMIDLLRGTHRSQGFPSGFFLLSFSLKLRLREIS